MRPRKRAAFTLLLVSIFIMACATTARCEETLPDSTYQETYDEFQVDSGLPEEEIAEPEYPRGRVIAVLDQTQEETEFSGGNFNTSIQMLEVLILNGAHTGKTVQAQYMLNYGFSDKYEYTRLSKGDEVLLYLQENEQGVIEIAYVAEIVRDKYLFYLVIGFMLPCLL